MQACRKEPGPGGAGVVEIAAVIRNGLGRFTKSAAWPGWSWFDANSSAKTSSTNYLIAGSVFIMARRQGSLDKKAHWTKPEWTSLKSLYGAR